MATNGDAPNLPALFFVYGTLKRGRSNHDIIKGARFVSRAKTQKAYPLHISGLPYLLDDPGLGYHVEGELFEVTSFDMADRLDRLEGHPRFYTRKTISVVRDDNNEVAEVYAYLIAHDRIRAMVGDVTKIKLHKVF